jgi:hypothetical protein
MLRFAACVALAAVIVVACGDAPPAYDVTVTFNERFEQPAADEVSAVILAFDENADLRLQESFPPVLRGTLHSHRDDVCEEILRQLIDRDDVANLDCQPRD